MQIQHVPDYAYGEQLAAELEETDSRLSLKRSYESFARRLVELPNPWTDPRVAAVEAQLGSSPSEDGRPSPTTTSTGPSGSSTEPRTCTRRTLAPSPPSLPTASRILGVD